MAVNTGGRRSSRLSMTSLIDVIFLLLLFFMLSSTFTKYGEIELTNGLPGARVADSPVRFIRLDADRLLLNGRTVKLADLEGKLQPRKDGDRQTVLIALDDAATSQQLIDLLTTLRRLKDVTATVLG